jgi:hypothetical protein
VMTKDRPRWSFTSLTARIRVLARAFYGPFEVAWNASRPARRGAQGGS